ncbi:MAG: DUF1579 family protein [Planctomycetes bacterium]|nr:DUF1579 family protein [Planctomycetota bacterium]
MEMPKPGPNHKKLEAFAGSWSGEETMYPSVWDPKGGVATATTVARVICDGFYVAGDYEQSRGGQVTFRGHSVFGFDEKKGEVVSHWFDSMGMGVDIFRGKWEGQTIALLSSSPMGQHRLTYDFREAGIMRMKMEMSQDGKAWKAMFDGVYQRKN